MVKEKRILSYFFGWLFLGLFICLIGISDVFAATYYTNYNYSQQYYDNRGSSVVAVNTTWNESLQSYVSDNITTAANSYGAGLSITSPIPLLTNHTYTLSIYFEGLKNIAKSSKSNIAISTSLDGASYNYANNNFYAETLQTNVNNNSIIQFVFKVNSGGEYIFIPWTTTSTITQDYVITQINMEDLGSEGISQNDINNSLNNQTNVLNESIQNSTNIITGEINDMQQSIIDSNKETQDVIKDQFNTCRDSVNLLNLGTFIEGYVDLASGILLPNANNYSYYFKTSDLPDTITFSSKNGNRSNISYWNNKPTISGQSVVYGYPNFTDKVRTINVDKNYEYILIQFSYNSIPEEIQVQSGTVVTEYERPGEKICTNKLDEQVETSKGIWGTIKELPNMFLDMLKGLFIPDDLSFINEFKEVISNKLGFIASIPIQIIDFTLNLANIAFDEITTINFPSFEIFGVKFWNSEDIDITILLEKLKPFKYFTDLTCVILCCRTLYDMYHNFTGGGTN